MNIVHKADTEFSLYVLLSTAREYSVGLLTRVYRRIISPDQLFWFLGT